MSPNLSKLRPLPVADDVLEGVYKPTDFGDLYFAYGVTKERYERQVSEGRARDAVHTHAYALSLLRQIDGLKLNPVSRGTPAHGPRKVKVLR